MGRSSTRQTVAVESDSEAGGVGVEDPQVMADRLPTRPHEIDRDDLAGTAKKLSEWATMAARAYGIYAGINDAIRSAADKSTPAVHHADEMRRQMVLMSAIRTSALLDRCANISLQSVYRFIGHEDAIDLLAASYAASDPAWPLESALEDVREARERFIGRYETINWGAFGRLQSFRNNALAHIRIEVGKFIQYGELEQIIRTCAHLSGEFTLMTTGRNHWPEEEITDNRERSCVFWSAIFKADATDKLDY
jgi:hypothetical protein